MLQPRLLIMLGAVAELGWQPKFGLEDMLIDSWNWQKQNPNGFMQD